MGLAWFVALPTSRCFSDWLYFYPEALLSGSVCIDPWELQSNPQRSDEFFV